LLKDFLITGALLRVFKAWIGNLLLIQDLIFEDRSYGRSSKMKIENDRKGSGNSYKPRIE